MFQTELKKQQNHRSFRARKVLGRLTLVLLLLLLQSSHGFAQNFGVDPYYDPYYGTGRNTADVPNNNVSGNVEREFEQKSDAHSITLYSSEPSQPPLFEETLENDPYQGLVEPTNGFEPAIPGPGYDFGPSPSSVSIATNLPNVAMNTGPQYPIPQYPTSQPLTPPTVLHQPQSQQYQQNQPAPQSNFAPYMPTFPGQPLPQPAQRQELPQSTTAIIPPQSPLLHSAQSQMPVQGQSLGNLDAPVAPTLDGNSDQSNMILDVRVVGNGQIPLEKIRQKVKSRPNRPFNELQLEEDKRALTQTGWFVDVRPNIYRGSDGVTITFELIEFPLLHYVKFVGNRTFAKKRLAEEAGIAPGDALDPMSVMQAKTRIEEFYKSNGHHKIHVEVLRGNRPTDRGAIFYISEGGKQRVLRTVFIGNTVTPGGQLKKRIESKPGILYYIGGDFTREKLDQDVEKLIAFYRSLGYFFAKIDRDYVEGRGYSGLGAENSWITVRFIIDEGPRCKVSSLTITGNSVISDQEILDEMKKIKVGDYYNQMGLETDLLKIKDLYGRQGRVFTEVIPDYIVDSPAPNEGIVDLTLKIRESKPSQYGDVTVDILGADGGKESYTKVSTVLNRGPKIRPGKKVDTEEIRNTERRLKYSQLFNANPMQGYLPEVIFDVDEKTKAKLFEETIADERDGIFRGQSQNLNRRSPVEAEYNNIPPYDAPYVPNNTVPAGQSQPNNSPQHRDNRQQMIREQLQRTNNQMDQAVQQMNVTPQPQTVIRGQTTRSMPSMPSSTAVYQQPNYQQPSYATSGTVTNPVSTQPGDPYAQYGSVDPYNQNQQQYVVQQAAITTPQQQYQQYQQDTQVAATQPISAIPFSAPTLPSNTYPTTQSTPTPYYAPNNAVPPVQPQPYYNPSGSNSTNSYSGMTGGGRILAPPQPYIPGPGNPSTQGGGLMDPVMPGSTGLQDYANSMFFPKPEPMLTVPAKIRVMETQTGQLMASIGVNSDSGLVARFLYKEDNFDWRRPPRNPFRFEDWRNAYRGAGQRFKIEAMPGTQVQRYEIGWEEPYFLNTNVSLGLTGYYYNRIYTEWSEQRAGGTMSLGYKLTPDFTINSYYKGESVEIYKPIMYGIPDLDRALGTNALHTFGLRLTHDTRDNPNLATEGHMITVGAEQICGSYQYPRLFADARQYFMLRERPDTSGRWVLGFRSAASWTDIDTPIFERYYAGGFTTIRGFDFRGVSPRWSGIPVGGNFEFYNGAELLFPISADDMIRGVAFVDTGCVQPHVNDWAQKYRIAPGFGLRISIPFMGPAPIAFDFAFPILKDPADDVNIFSFYIGWMR